jgi:prophage regulatory protein
MHLLILAAFADPLSNTAQEIYASADMRFIRAKELYGPGSITGHRRSSFYRAVKNGSFPPPVLIGPRSVAWDSDAVDKWLASRPTRQVSRVISTMRATL